MKLFKYKWFNKENRLASYLHIGVSCFFWGSTVYFGYIFYRANMNPAFAESTVYFPGLLALALMVTVGLLFFQHSEKYDLYDRLERLEAKP